MSLDFFNFFMFLLHENSVKAMHFGTVISHLKKLVCSAGLWIRNRKCLHGIKSVFTLLLNESAGQPDVCRKRCG